VRNIRAEKTIDRILAGRFFLDTSRYDVTELDDYAEISGALVNRRTGVRLSDLQEKEIERYFKRGTVEGVDRFVFHVRTHAGA
jgi:hypothetical protein